jgi:hypothetical protein
VTRRALPLLLLIAVACGGRSKTDTTAASGDATGGAPELAVLDRFQALDDQVEKSRGECPRLASSIDRWLDGNQADVSALMEKARSQPSLDGARADEVEQHLERIFDRLLDAVSACKGQGGVEKAYARLDAFLEAS